uniref:Uncharacterized protein n=1 Tax=Nelumbo nucifera TaxID=4432 RepID=A0A822Y869_NELNU|nr:TPA_asm: hypothetical protein HUJ06_028693 [Nelumbo nucifera]
MRKLTTSPKGMNQCSCGISGCEHLNCQQLWVSGCPTSSRISSLNILPIVTSCSARKLNGLYNFVFNVMTGKILVGSRMLLLLLLPLLHTKFYYLLGRFHTCNLSRCSRQKSNILSTFLSVEDF